MRPVRICKKCMIEKPYSEFYVNSKGNRPSTCKECKRKAERSRKRSRSDQEAAAYHEWRLENRGHALVNVARYRAKKRGMPFDLDPEDIQARIDAGRCELTRIPFNLDQPRSWNAPSLDQINPGAGYTKANVRVVLYAVNVMANTWGHGRILEIASAIMDRRKAASNALSDRLGEKLKELMSQFGSMEYVQTWNRRVTPSGHVYWEHTASPRRTSGKGCSGSPTIRSSDGVGLPTLDHPAGWPTPMAGSPATETHNAAGNTDFSRKVEALAGWVTPSAFDATNQNTPETWAARQERNANTGGKASAKDLAVQCQLATIPGGWGTPSARDGKDAGPALEANPDLVPAESRLPRMVLGATSVSSTAGTGKSGGSVLNPAMSRWLMGYPRSGATPGWDNSSPGWSSWVTVQKLLAELSTTPGPTA